LIVGDHTASSGMVGVALAGDLSLAPTLSLGCRPIGEPLFITRANPGDNTIAELDGRGVLDVLTRLHDELDPHARALFERGLCIGLVMDADKREYGPRDYLIRDIVRVDTTAGRMRVAGPVANYQVVQFHLRDAATSTADLEQALAQRRAAHPRGGLLVSSVGRGQQLYGRRNHDSDVIRGHVGDVPLGGFFSAGEIGPVGARTFVHGYASVLGLFADGP
jgi:small ligand-binding sensory domain FIST